MNKRFKILLIVEQCNPEWSSVPLVAYKFYRELSQLVDVTLVTHERNENALKKINERKNITYINESNISKQYYKLTANLTSKTKVNWPLYHTLNYFIYEEFNQKVYHHFNKQISNGEYDLVHALTPMNPRYPVKAVKACKHTPFLLGPVNGGVPFPKGFSEIARKEYAYLNFLRAIGRTLIPGYVETYKKADKILAGSTYTLNMLKQMFELSPNKISLFYENGIPKEFFTVNQKNRAGEKINLLFVGRLVPYKGADILIEAVSQLERSLRNKIIITIVGDGSERSSLEKKVQELNLVEQVRFEGWVSQQETLNYYSQADIFCFPSIREFGGAVVLEAMACGLPCIVVNNGGIGEYVTEETGFKIEPVSREYLTQELTNKIKILGENQELWQTMSTKSIERAREFTWENKAKKIVEIYEEMMANKAIKT